MHRRDWPDYAGLRHWGKARSTGTTVAIYNGDEGDFDTAGGAWSIMCETHGCVIAVDTLKMAREWVTHPEYWCDVDGGCMGIEGAD
jgi:hypothetical protein